MFFPIKWFLTWFPYVFKLTANWILPTAGGLSDEKWEGEWVYRNLQRG